MLKGKGPVVHLNRTDKAKMIESILEYYYGKPINNLKILDVGTGNGQIATYFAKDNMVWSVDVDDQRHENIGEFNFSIVLDERLPFEDEKFDISISHHVIEHVADQTLHIAELKRVTKLKGKIYLACPNKSSPFMAGHIGNDMVPTIEKVRKLVKESGLKFHDAYPLYVKYPKRFHCQTKLFSLFPLWLIKIIRKYLPGHCFIIDR